MSEGAASIFDQASRVTPAYLERLSRSVTPTGEASLDVTNPITGEVVGDVPDQSPAEVISAVERARDAQPRWAERPIEERVAILRDFVELVLEHRARMLDIIQLETGKSRFDALEEVLEVFVTSQYYAGYAQTILEAETRTSLIPFLTSATEYRRPKGVVGVITPWNYPLAIPMADTLPALLAGNTAVVKPAEETPFTTLMARSLLERAGLPADVLTVVTGDGPTVGETLIDHVDYVAFTGSVEVGRSVGARTGRRLIGCTLELGGKNPFIVLDDADPTKAAAGAHWASFSNAGQLCLSTERIIVTGEHFDDFVDAFVRKARSLRLDAGFDMTYAVGSLIDEAHHDAVASYVDEAVEAGASVLSGGRSRPDLGPAFYEPTILTDVPDEVAVASEEVFGPVVTVEQVDDEEAAIARANSTDGNLHAVIWTGDTDRGERVATELDAGMVSINDAYFASYGTLDAPMGGIGDTGVGHRQGRTGILRYTDRQSVVTNRGFRLTKPDWLPERGYEPLLVILAWFVGKLSHRS